jgi:chromosome segregation ATPase
MKGPNGGQHDPANLDEIYRLVASLDVKLDKIVSTQEAMKAEIKTIPPRLDTLTREIDQLGERVHRGNNVVQALTDETGSLHQTQLTLERALAVFELDMKVKQIGLERTQKLFEHALEMLEGRVRQMRDDLADVVSEERSGVIPSPNSSGGHHGHE